MRPRSFEQKTSYKYRLVHNNAYVFEIARYDVYGDPKDENIPVHTSWTASLYNREWDSTLAGNSELDIGSVALEVIMYSECSFSSRIPGMRPKNP